MADVLRPAALASVYHAALTRIKAREIPTVVMPSGQTVFRSINPNSIHTPLSKPAPGGHVSKFKANKCLAPSDGARDSQNRFSGPSYDSTVPASGGLYCAQQQQALVNEAMYYANAGGNLAFAGRCILKIRIMGSLLMADLSPHNPGAMHFLSSLGPNTWREMEDPADCSVARGIGLAVAKSGYLRGLSAQTVRTSERSSEERGDNLVFFGTQDEQVRGLYIEEAWFFDSKGNPERFPAEFP